MLIQRRKYIS